MWESTAGHVTIVNNTFDSNTRGFYSLSRSTIAKNNIVSNSSEYGVHGVFATLSYNDVWNNHPDYQGDAEPANSISGDPQYVNRPAMTTACLRVRPVLTLVIRRSEYQDPDGTRNDIGAFPLVLDYHGVENLAIDGSSFHHITNHTPTFHWQYRDTTTELQSRYQLEIGSDVDWTDCRIVVNWRSFQRGRHGHLRRIGTARRQYLLREDSSRQFSRLEYLVRLSVQHEFLADRADPSGSDSSRQHAGSSRRTFSKQLERRRI